LGQTAAGLSKEQKAAIVVPQETQEVFTGMLLSDGTLQVHGKMCRLQIMQKDLAFVQVVWELCKSIGIVGATPKRNAHYDARSGQTKYTDSFVTILCLTLLSSLTFGIH
jgi:hypothetical protein